MFTRWVALMSGDGGIKEKVIRAYTEEMDIQTFGQSFEFLSIQIFIKKYPYLANKTNTKF